MRPLVEPLRAWEYDRYGRLVAVTVKRSYGYEVQQAHRLGDRVEIVPHFEDVAPVAAAMERRRLA